MRRNRILSFCCAIALLGGMFAMPTGAANSAPTPPSWIPAEEYQVFEGDPLYTSENWVSVLTLRQQVEAVTTETVQEFFDRVKWVLPQSGSPATSYEAGLIYERLLQRKVETRYLSRYRVSCDMRNYMRACLKAEVALGQKPTYISLMWYWRGVAQAGQDSLQKRVEQGRATEASSLVLELFAGDADHTGSQATWASLMQYPQYNFEFVTNYSGYDYAKSLPVWAKLKDYTYLIVNNFLVYPEAEPEVVNGTTMVPIRNVISCLSPEITWDAETQMVTIVSTSNHISLTLGYPTVFNNGQAFTLPVAPYAKNGRTFLPLRFVSEQLGLKVDWKPGMVTVWEDTSLLQSSNVDDWALGMGSVLASLNGRKKYESFGSTDGGRRDGSGASRLSGSWDIHNRQDLFVQVAALNAGKGHAAAFQNELKEMRGLTEAERNTITSTYSDGFMCNQILGYGTKWGDRGLIAWDLCRVSNLVQWGYNCGYITLEEALVLMRPAAEQFKTLFANWDEGMENYADGYMWWSRTDNSFRSPRFVIYKQLKGTNPSFYRDEMFKEDIRLDSLLSYQTLIGS